MTSHDIAMPIDSGNLTVNGARSLQEVKILAHDPETAPDSSHEDLPGDPTQIAKAVQLGVVRFTGELRSINGTIATIFEHESVCIIVAADNFSGFADSKSHSAESGIRVVDAGEPSCVA